MLKLNDKNVLVTGAAGKLGNYVSEYLHKKGYNVTCTDVALPKPDSRIAKLKLPFVKGDLMELGDIMKAIAMAQCGTIVHLGAIIHNVELKSGNGGQLARSAGNGAQLMAKEGDYAQVRLPSGEVRLIRLDCKATIGQVGNIEHENINLGKAGKKRHMGVRPTVRGSVMNPCDHPHGGGEGKSPIGRPSPVTPWGKPTMGYKTRDKKARTNKFIVKRRNDK